ncbi:MAG TPA: DUF58 domain-containing protein [Egibacteraceae bacterium]|nr:DUF58 domain-containing protein [Egibacteraceae bacterium]
MAPRRRRPGLPVPTWRLAAAAAVAAVAVLAVPADPLLTLLAANGALLVAAAVDALRAAPPEDLGVTRELPGVVPLDGRAEIVWRVTNPTGRRLRLRLADALAPSLRAATRRARLVVPARGRAAGRTAINPSRRGRFALSEVTLRVEGPWGLAARQGRQVVAGVVRVYPPFRSRQEAELRLTRARILEVGLRSARGRGGGTEFDSLRDYQPDDEFGRIDWAATARAGKPIVRTYRAERNQTVLLLLDTGRTMAARIPWADDRGAGQPRAPGDWVPRLDHAMDAVMMLTAVSTRLGDRAGLVAFADRVRAVVAPGHSRDQLGRVTEAMYALEPELVESDYRGAFVETLGRFRRRALLVLFTELAEQAAAETLLPALPLVARSHIVLVAAVRDPAVARWARALPTEAATAYRKAAAVQALAERRRTVARLRGLGAVVVDAGPGRLAPELADAYLRVKAAGRL